MKTILIATDFSQASRNASLYGIELAKAFYAKVILFSAYQMPVVPSTINEGMIITPPPQTKESTLQYLIAEAAEINPQNLVSLETCSEEGQACRSIIDKANKIKADLIVTGMKGSGKNIRKIFGSTVTALSRKTNIPLLVVPEEATYTEPKTIAFANDINEDTDVHVVNLLQEIGLKFKSKVYLLRVIKNQMNEVYDMLFRPVRLTKLLKNLNTSYEFPKDHNVAHALNAFSKEHAVDIVVMIPHRHNLLESLFIKSNTKDMIYHTHVPLLILPDKIPEYNSAEEKNATKQGLICIPHSEHFMS